MKCWNHNCMQGAKNAIKIAHNIWYYIELIEKKQGVDNRKNIFCVWENGSRQKTYTMRHKDKNTRKYGSFTT